MHKTTIVISSLWCRPKFLGRSTMSVCEGCCDKDTCIFPTVHTHAKLNGPRSWDPCAILAQAMSQVRIVFLKTRPPGAPKNKGESGVASRPRFNSGPTVRVGGFKGFEAEPHSKMNRPPKSWPHPTKHAIDNTSCGKKGSVIITSLWVRPKYLGRGTMM